MRGARLDDAYLDGTTFDGADLEGARLDRAHLEGATLIGTNLKGARFDNAHVAGAQLEGAILDNAHLEGAVGLTADQLSAAASFVDAVLPQDVTRPSRERLA